MDNFKDGGPAFPRDHRHDGHNGMTLRDWFAGQIMANLADPTMQDGWPDEAARRAYKYADALLKARGATP